MMGASPLRVLIVDDEKDICDTLSWLLELEGFLVRSIGYAGPEAEALAADFRPQVALVDIGLHGKSGLTLVPALVALGASPICMSGFGTREDRQHAKAAGCVDFVLKPATFEEVLAAVKRHALGSSND